MRIEAKLEELGLVLPEPMQVPSGLCSYPSPGCACAATGPTSPVIYP
jgi:hypothetical protein